MSTEVLPMLTVYCCIDLTEPNDDEFEYRCSPAAPESPTWLNLDTYAKEWHIVERYSYTLAPHPQEALITVAMVSKQPKPEVIVPFATDDMALSIFMAGDRVYTSSIQGGEIHAPEESVIPEFEPGTADSLPPKYRVERYHTLESKDNSAPFKRIYLAQLAPIGELVPA